MANLVEDIYHRTIEGERNLSFVERAASVGFGLALAAGGLRRLGWQGALMGVAGGLLAARGLSGHCAVKQMIEDRNGQSPRIADRSPGPVRAF